MQDPTEERDVSQENFDSIFSPAPFVVESLEHDDFVRHHLDALQPVVVRGAVNNWPAVGKWSLAYLKQSIGEKTVPIGTLSATPVATKTMRVADLIDQLKDYPDSESRTAYLTKTNIHDAFPKLSADVLPHPGYALPDRHSNRMLVKNLHYPRGQMEMLMGGGGLGFPLHYDRGFIHAFIMQIIGEKDVVVISPEYSEHLYPSEHYESVSSIENIWKPDLAKYPALRNVKGFHARLTPGDMVFVPSNWWHATRLPGISVGATCNTITRSNWKRYSDFLVANKKRQKAGVEHLVWRAYMKAVGASSRLHETLFGR